jgi:hypothetical protein
MYNYDHYQDQDLRSRVEQLKEISIAINNELEDQKKLLNSVEGDFEIFGVNLTASMKSLKHLIKSESGLWVWVLIAFALGVFGFIYIFRL